MKWSLYGLIAVLLYIFWGWIKTTKQMLQLQRVAQTYPVEFRVFIENEEGWEVYDMNHKGKGCIKIIPEPQISTSYYYYIKFIGPISEKDAIDFLIRNFMKYIKDLGK